MLSIENAELQCNDNLAANAFGKRLCISGKADDDVHIELHRNHVKLGDDDLKSVADGVTAGLDLEGIGKKAGGFLAKLKSLFGGK